MKIAFIGYGQVGSALADQLQRRGHQVTLAAHDATSNSVQRSLQRNPALLVQSPQSAIHSAEVVFLATPFSANASVLEDMKQELIGKIVVDCTNPVGAGLSHGLNSVQSGSEMVQSLIPLSKVVKAFTIYGFENFEDNHFPTYNIKPTMMFCGNDPEAKLVVSQLISDLAWEPLDVGDLKQALHLEHMTLLWIRMVRMQQRSPYTVWAMLQK
ncbi:MAG: NADPH-dependent F420 reductase [Planctomycetes bacterium]|nr:NADPH-dependent F420 reductase [Planctomycetota bacterium]